MDLMVIILEMQEKMIKLEKRVDELEKQLSEKENQIKSESKKDIQTEHDNCRNVNSDISVRRRDKTRYMYKGNIYLKNQLVFNVVKDYVVKYPNISRYELAEIFPRELQGSIGVVVNIEVAKMRNDYSVRFFSKDDEILHLRDGDMVVCSQWGILNIPKFVDKAQGMGVKIEEIG